MAVLWDKRQGGHASDAKVPSVPAKIVRMERTLDCRDVNIASGDTVQLLHIPAGAVILQCSIEVERLEGGTLTIDVGAYTHSSDAAIDADGFFNDANLNSALGTICGATTGVLTFPYKSSTDVAMDISALFNNAADLARFAVRAVVLDMGDTMIDQRSN